MTFEVGQKVRLTYETAIDPYFYFNWWDNLNRIPSKVIHQTLKETVFTVVDIQGDITHDDPQESLIVIASDNPLFDSDSRYVNTFRYELEQAE